MPASPELLAAIDTIRRHGSHALPAAATTPLEAAKIARGLACALFDLRHEYDNNSDEMLALGIAHCVMIFETVKMLEAEAGA